MTGRYGRLPKQHDGRDYAFRSPAKYAGEFVDLSDRFPEKPYDQLDLGSCVSNGTAAALDYARAKQGLKPYKRPARLFIYWYGRKTGGYPQDEDAGLQVRDGLHAVARYGAPPEDQDWPYDPTTYAMDPSSKAQTDALDDEATRYGAVDRKDIDATIAAGYPVVFGFDVFESFESEQVAKTGVVPVPAPGETPVGGHCVVAVSTQKDGADIPGAVPGMAYRKCRNSWGTSWGCPDDPGHFWMPVDVMDGAESSDFWVITTVSDPHTPQPVPDPFPGVLLASVNGAAVDPMVGQFLRRHYVADGPAASAQAWLMRILSAPRA